MVGSGFKVNGSRSLGSPRVDWLPALRRVTDGRMMVQREDEGRSRLHGIEHGGLLVKEVKEFLGLRMIFGDDNSHVFFCFRFFSLDFYCFKVIVLLLTGFVKPERKKTCSLGLLLPSGAAHVKQYVWISVEEFFNDAKNGLPYFLVIGRGSTTHVDKVKPIGNKLRIILQREVYKVFQPVVRFKTTCQGTGD